VSVPAFDPDLVGSASHLHMVRHLTAPFAGGAADNPVPVAGAKATVAWEAREPLLVVAPRSPLDTDSLVLTARVDGAQADLPAVTFAPYTEAGAFLSLYRPAVAQATGRAQPFALALTLARVGPEGISTPIAANDVGDAVELRLLEGVLGRVLYVLGAEKQRLRRQGRELAAMRLLARAGGDALDRLGADVGVPRFSDLIEWDAASAQIVTRRRTEPDGVENDREYRRRLALYRRFLVPTPRRVNELLNGDADPAAPNTGPLHELDAALAARFAVTEDFNPFAVAVHLVSTGSDRTRTNFLEYVRREHLVWPKNSAAGNDAHADRLLPRVVRERQDALRARLRGDFNFTGDASTDPALAPLLADTLDRVAKVRTALGSQARWRIVRAQKSDGGSRYELGFGVDLQIPTDFDRLAQRLQDRGRQPNRDPEVEAILSSMTPRPSADDPDGRWFLEPCGLRTVQRVDAKTVYVSHLPVFGLVVDGPANVSVPGWATLVPGSFGGPTGNDLLAYDRLNGTGQFYSVNPDGTLTATGALKTNWRKSWDIIVPGRFRAGMPAEGLLFYDREAGEAEFYSFQWRSDVFAQLGQTQTGWRKTWLEIVPGRFGADRRYSDLLLYDPELGELEFLVGNPSDPRRVGVVSGVRRTWTHIVPGSFSDAGTTDLLFYDRGAGLGEFHTVPEPGRLRLLAQHPDWQRSWSHVLAGFFYTDQGKDLLFYDRDSGASEVYTTDGEGDLTLISEQPWATGWTHVLPRSWSGPGYTELLFYDRGTARATFGRLTPTGKPPPSRLELATFGSVAPPALPQLPTFQAHYYAAESQGSHAVLQQGLTAAASAWQAGRHEAWTTLGKGDGSAAWAAAAVNDAARQAFMDAGLPNLGDPTRVAPQLGAVPLELLDTLKLGPTLSNAVQGGGGVAELKALVEALRDSDLSSALGFVSATDAFVVVGATGLPLAGLNLSERPSSGFRWYSIPLAGLRAEVGSSGATTTFRAVEEGLSALVLLGYVRRHGLVDPYQFRVDLPDGASLSLLQYEFLMNLLDYAHPAGVGVDTYSIRQRHVVLGAGVVPMPPNVSHTYRPFRRPRGRGETAAALPAAAPPTGLPTWSSLGGTIESLSVGANKDNRLEAFGRGPAGDLAHVWDTGGAGWSTWASLDGPPNVALVRAPVVAANADGRLEAFARGSDGALWHVWQTSPGDGWDGWSSLGGQIRDLIVVAANANGALSVFAPTPNGDVGVITQSAPSNGWGAWGTLGGSVPDVVAVGRNADGRLEVFARGNDGALWHNLQTAANGAWTTGWTSLGGSVQNALAVGANQDGRLQAFTCADDDTVGTVAQTAAGGPWGAWSSLGGSVGHALGVGTQADGRLEVVAAGTDNELAHAGQAALNGAFGAWAPFGIAATDFVQVVARSDKRLEVFVRGPDKGLWHTWQTTPNGGWNT